MGKQSREDGPADLQRALDVYEHARSLGADARGVYLDITCAGDDDLRSRVEAMLAVPPARDAPLASAEPKRVPDSGSDLGELHDAAESQLLPVGQRRIGSYSILGILGRGGMGEVFRARQVNPEREVALKVLLPGSTSEAAMRRFELEAKVLAKLQHPAIAHVYEAGVHDDWPYFAMELVRGVPPTEHAKRARLNTRERLELFLRICDGVHHAHLRGVIHRDLKPGNILVDRQGQPKILDFGVARSNDSDLQPTEAQTSEGQIVGTLPYMSPEQAAGQVDSVDTRTDVYALGVILYELLVGRHPIDLRGKLIPVAVHHIQVTEPSKPGSINANLRGDLETIMLTALSKERERRYQSVYDLGADIRRFMNDEPITARAPSAIYHWRKFARRNRTWVVAAALLLISLAAGSVTSTYMYVRAEDARQVAAGEAENARMAQMQAEESFQDALAAQAEAESALTRAEKASESSRAAYGFLSDSLDAMFTGGSVPPPSLRQFLESARQRVGRDLAEHPIAEARLRRTIATAYQETGNLDIAQEQIEIALKRLRESEEPTAWLEASILRTFGAIAAQRENDDEAADYFAEAIAIVREMGEAELPALARYLVFAAVNDADRGALEQSAELTLEALQLSEQFADDDRISYQRVVSQAGNLYWRHGRLVEAEMRLRESLELCLDLYGRESRATAEAYRDLGQFLIEDDRLDEGGQLLREFVAVRGQIYGQNHPSYANALHHLQLLLSKQGKTRESIDVAYRVIEIRRANGDTSSGEVARALNNLAGEYWRLGEMEKAADTLEESMRLHREVHGDQHPDVATGLSNLAILKMELGEHAAAEGILVDAIELQETLTPGDHPLLVRWYSMLALCQQTLDRDDEAVVSMERAVEMADRVFPPGHQGRAEVRQSFGAMLLASNRDGEAEPMLLTAFESLSRIYGIEHAKTQLVVRDMVDLCERAGRDEEREAWEERLVPESDE